MIRVESAVLFAKADGDHCKRFLERVFQAPEIRGAAIIPRDKPSIDLLFDSAKHRPRNLLARLADLIGDGAGSKVIVAPAFTARDRHGVVRYHKYDDLVTGWQVISEQPGTIKLKNPVLYRKAVLCQAIERELMSVLGIDRYDTSASRCSVRVEYDPRQLAPSHIIEILDTALANAEHPERLDKIDLDLPISTASVPLAAVAQLAAPALLPVAAAVFAYTAIPSFRGAYRVLFKEKRLGVDLLDSIVVLGCLATVEVLPGAILVFSLATGRFLVRRTEDNSKKLLQGVFGKQARYVWLLKDGVEVQVPLDRLQKGDVVAVNTGEVVPVDGIIVNGLAMVDQHALTGEATPAEKGVGDRVFASTIMVAGKMSVQVETSGSDTASAKIARILEDTAGHKLASQHEGERLADKAVIPTLAIGAVALATMGPPGAVAVINSDFGTGIRMAAPLAMLSTLALCAQKGILVKDGRALDILCDIDTVIFDKTGTLTRERPEIGRIVAANGFAPEQILGFAAAAEQRFHHPIALAILDRASDQGLELPPTDATQYKVGYGISVGVEGRRIRVGSRRFIEAEGIALPPEIEAALTEAHDNGHTMVMVAVDDQFGGALELRAAVRPEVRGIVQGLRRARHQAYRDHLRRPRGADAATRERSGDGSLLRPGDAGGQSRLRREVAARGPQGLLRWRRHQRFDRAEAGGCRHFPARRVADRHRHCACGVHGAKPRQAVRTARHRARPEAQCPQQLGHDHRPERGLYRRRVHAGVRHCRVRRDQQCRRPGRACQRDLADAQSGATRGRAAPHAGFAAALTSRRVWLTGQCRAV